VISKRGAKKRCQRYRQIWNNYFIIDVLLRKCLQIVIFNQLEVPPNFLNGLKGAANQKRLKNTGLGTFKKKKTCSLIPSLLSTFHRLSMQGLSKLFHLPDIFVLFNLSLTTTNKVCSL
jgi:hypothetical protein